MKGVIFLASFVVFATVVTAVPTLKSQGPDWEKLAQHSAKVRETVPAIMRRAVDILKKDNDEYGTMISYFTEQDHIPKILSRLDRIDISIELERLDMEEVDLEHLIISQILFQWAGGIFFYGWEGVPSELAKSLVALHYWEAQAVVTYNFGILQWGARKNGNARFDMGNTNFAELENTIQENLEFIRSQKSGDKAAMAKIQQRLGEFGKKINVQ